LTPLVTPPSTPTPTKTTWQTFIPIVQH
jgi:hypothetical protein